MLLERLATSRSNEMVQLLTQKYDYKQISVESSERIYDNEKLLLICMDPHMANTMKYGW